MKRCEMERTGQMKEFLESKKDFLISQRIKRMEELYNGNAGNLQNDLESALRRLTPNNGEGKLALSYLRSSYLLGRYELYIAYYQEELFVEEEPDCIYFDIQYGLYPAGQLENGDSAEGIARDVRELEENLHGKFNRISQGEKEEIHKWYAEQVCRRFADIVKILLEKCQGEKRTEVYYGGYMDTAELIGRI